MVANAGFTEKVERVGNVARQRKRVLGRGNQYKRPWAGTYLACWNSSKEASVAAIG